jgi:hypothetical protein
VFVPAPIIRGGHDMPRAVAMLLAVIGSQNASSKGGGHAYDECATPDIGCGG